MITRYFKPYFIRRAARANDQISTLPSEETPLLIPPDQIEAVATGADTSDTGPQHVAPVYFDYVLLCFCLLAEVVGYTVLGSNAKGSAAIYIVTSAWLHLGAPASACAISMAVALGPGDHTSSGRLFGALGILDGLSSIFISPLLFTSVFSATLAFYPPATFLVAAACWLLGLLAVRCIKLPRTSRDSASA